MLELPEHAVADLFVEQERIKCREDFRDGHFELYVAAEMNSILKCFVFINDLEDECDGCDKARTIRSYLFGEHGDLWRSDGRWKSIITLARHIHCRNHLSDSFCLRGQS